MHSAKGFASHIPSSPKGFTSHISLPSVYDTAGSPKTIVPPTVPDQTRFRPELVDATAYIAPGAVVVGDVTIGAESSVWFNAVVRGDCEAIRIGRRTNIQDGCILHADPGVPCVLGDDVTVGHGAVVHGANVADRVIIGMKAVVMNGAQIGEDAIVAVGAVVTEGTVIPPRSIAMGIPARARGEVTDEHLAQIRHAAAHYVEYAKRYAASK
jgi:carbonic anhydrase/acetyltransferase-like protein (isoleucine patch superfamily)